MIKIKQGVNIYGLQPEMITVNQTAEAIFSSFGYDLIVTSAVRSMGDTFSLHPFGFACDYRSRHVKTYDEKDAIENELKAALPDCDIKLKQVNLRNEHIHCEYDPKNNPEFAKAKLNASRTGKWQR